MINEIIDGISIALNEEFGDAYEIYTESIEQGLTEPCFSIVGVSQSMELFRGHRYIARNQFCVYFFPSTEDKRQECQDVAVRLYECLEHITAGDDLIRGTGMNAKITDDVLSFLVDFDFFVRKDAEVIPEMETYSLDSDVKG